MSENASPSAKPPVGIGGWLILPAIGIVVTPFALLFGLKDYPDLLGQVPSGTSLHSALVVEGVITLGFVVWTAVTAYLFFSKRRVTPKSYIALLAGFVVWMLVEVFLILPWIGLRAQPRDLGDLARTVIAAAIWIPYFLRSLRVRLTFVE